MKYFNIGTLNVRDINTKEQREDLTKDMIKYEMDICSITETHIPIDQFRDEITIKRSKYVIYSANKDKNPHHGVGFIIKEHLKPTFKKIDDRICTAKIPYKKHNILFISVYAPTLKQCETEPHIREELYEKIEKIINNTPERDALIIGGDFNAKVGQSWKDFPENTGKFSKGHINSSGRFLLELCKKHNLYITNTTFKHKMTHRTTWTAPFRNFTTYNGEERRNPIRNQIDFIIMSNKHRSFVTNARSYSGICTETDHKLVKTNTHFQWQYIYSKQNKEIKINTQNFNTKENQEKYKKCLKSLINEQKLEQNLTSQETWNKIVKSCKQAGEVVLGKVPRNRKADDQQLQILSRK